MKKTKNARAGRRIFSPVFLVSAALIIISAVFLVSAVIPGSVRNQEKQDPSAAVHKELSEREKSDSGSQNTEPQEEQNRDAETETAAQAAEETVPPSGENAGSSVKETPSESGNSGSSAGSVSSAGSPDKGGAPNNTEQSTGGASLPPSPSDPAGTGQPDPADGRYAYLTFDDGPSRNTEQILNILAENDIRATFFVIGRTDEASIQRYRMIAEAGHTIGMHSYTHNYGEIYASMDAFRADFERISGLLTQITGSEPTLYRFPGGSSNTLSSRRVTMTEMIQFLNERNIPYFDWNVNSADASGRNPDPQLLIQNVKNGLKYKHNIILMHDAAGHESTVEALPGIIRACRDKGLTFRTITKDTPPAHHHRRD